MKFREFGRTGWDVSTIGFGAWAIGADWGIVEKEDAIAALHTSLDEGVNLFDTADVYGDGRSEKLLAQLKSERSEEFYTITKAGRRLNPHTSEGYTRENLTQFVERSLINLQTETLDLVQLHCPPTEVYYQPEVFGILDDLVQAGKIRYYGVSVEKVEEALIAIEYPNVQSVQIIFNIFRQRSSELFFKEAKRRKVGILARVPLSSGMLTGKFNEKSTFSSNDHRQYNRHGEAFDVGETFSGVDYALSLKAVQEIRNLVPEGVTMAQFALRWILMFEEVSCTIPGAKNSQQAEDNASSADLNELTEETMAEIKLIYDSLIKKHVHQRW
jgi:aryl-alcohol dehydrogenase-like predicted oxidoreductase